MLHTMAAAYEVAQLRGQALHPSQLLWLATVGSARALRAEHRIGNLSPGMEADIVVLDLASTPAIEQATRRASTLWEAVFPTIMMGDDRAVAAVWVNGRPLS
jgi:guanine deaminase